MLDFIRIACAVPPVRVGDVLKNVEDICAKSRKLTKLAVMWLFFRNWP